MNPFAERCAALEARLAAAGADAAVACPGPNLAYLAGWRGEPGDRHTPLVVEPGAEPRMVAPAPYLAQVREETWPERIRTAAANDPQDVAAAVADDLPAGGEVLLDDHARQSFARGLRDRLGAETIRPLDDHLRPLRRRKGPEELAALRRAAAVADDVSAAVRGLGADAVGLTEADLARRIRERLHAKGGERLSFDVVVASGPRSAEPSLRHGERTIDPGDPVTLDFGAFVDGYAGDQTRVVVFEGDPAAAFERVHAAVRRALEAGVAAAEPGVEAREVHRAATGALEASGYGDARKHGTGHGVGLAAHEPLSIDGDSDVTLEPGMVFSVEPGVYLDGEFGVRLEDLVAVTEEGAERLNGSPYGWRPPPTEPGSENR
jgi:Xaa-Pro aminopeptidase